MTIVKTTAKDKVLKVFENLMENSGYVQVSARSIAKEAGISVGTLYHHYPNGKLDILVAIGEKYGEILKISEFLADPNADLKAWLRKDLRLSQNKRAFITAMEIEAMSRPEEFKSYFEENLVMNTQLQKTTIVAYKMMNKFAGKELSKEKGYKMILVLKALIRRHVVFGNIFGSDDDFIDLLLTIIKAIAED